MPKTYLDIDVMRAAEARLDHVFARFERVYASFSGGKDSGVLLNLAIEAARRAGRLPLDVMVIDLEAQYRLTAEYVAAQMARPEVRPWWICLPLHLRNAVSNTEPHWLCWDPDARERWVREFPQAPGVISDEAFFPFFRRGMEFEEFVPAFGEWLSGGKPTACLVAIRADESLNRYRTIASRAKERFEGLAWTTRVTPSVVNAYPIYDWRTEDVWRANGKRGWDYNRVYDLMYRAGVSIHEQRLCQPYGDDQRRGLHLFHVLEPETWTRVVGRVAGANIGKIYNGTIALGDKRVHLPPGHTWKSYAHLLLSTMPDVTRTHYEKKIAVFLRWWNDRLQTERFAHLGLTEVPDEADRKLEGARKAPSWRRICKVLLKNDYWCKGLSFSQTKKEHERQLAVFNRWMEEL